MLTIRPIVSTLRHHKAGTILIALQIALTLAVVCNALFVIRSRIERTSRETGVAESELLVVNNRWVGNTNDFPARQAADLVTVRGLAGVADAFATNAFPLLGDGWQSSVRRQPTDANAVMVSSVYFVDDHALATLGAKLVSGRNFRSDEIGVKEESGSPDAPSIIVTRALADRVFPDGNALGKAMYLGNVGARPSTIVGIVDHLQGPSLRTDDDKEWLSVVLVPMRLTGNGAFFVVRAKPGQLQSLVKTVPAALAAASSLRVIPQPHGVMTFAEVRDMAYSSDRGLAWMMGGICLVLLVVTAAGIVGLTSFWVGQRRRQIGIRRALGATRNDIIVYFLTENVLISASGLAGGLLLAFGLNQWMMAEFETARLSLVYVGVGALTLLLLGQLAVLSPALRASRVPPVEATRTI